MFYILIDNVIPIWDCLHSQIQYIIYEKSRLNNNFQFNIYDISTEKDKNKMNIYQHYKVIKLIK